MPRLDKPDRVVALARTHTERAIAKLAELLDSDDHRVAVVAAQTILDRGWGSVRDKDKQQAEVRAEDRDAILARLNERLERGITEAERKQAEADTEQRRLAARAGLGHDDA